MRPTLARLAGQIRRLRRDTTAVSAVEFAMLLPVMLLLLLGTFDIARAIDVKNRTTLLSHAVSNFVSQNRTVTPAVLANIVQASRPIMYPYEFDASVLSIGIQSIRKSDDEFIIDWSYEAGTADANTNAPLDLTEFTPPDASVVRTTVDYTYNLKFAGFLFDKIGFKSIQMQSADYAVPRAGVPVEPSQFPN